MRWTRRVCPAAFRANLGSLRIWNGGIFHSLFLVLFSLLMGQAGESQQQVSPDTTVREPRSFQASRVDRAPKMDGTLDDTAGQRFASLETDAPQYYQNSLTAKLTYSWRP